MWTIPIIEIIELELEGINSQKEYNACLDCTDMVKKHICSQHWYQPPKEIKE
jgi:hypothetical protein